MKTTTTAILVLFLAAAALADAPPREVFPSDYTPHPCAPELCSSIDRLAMMRDASTFRGEYISPRWLRANSDELLAAFQPVCAKIASCIATRGNDHIFCTDLMLGEFIATGDRFERGTEERRQWLYSAMAFYIGQFAPVRRAHKEAQECAARLPASETPRKLEVWMDPERIGPEYDGKLTVYALDAETRVPVMALVSVNTQDIARAIDSPSGKPITTYPLTWTLALNRVPNAEGYRDVVAPRMTVAAEGYEPVTFTMPVDVPKMTVEMNPPADRLKPGRNTVTIVARDTKTGEPVEARVMSGDYILGETNRPFVLDLPRGKKRPEIWVTSLFDRYSDVVVVPAEK